MCCQKEFRLLLTLKNSPQHCCKESCDEHYVLSIGDIVEIFQPQSYFGLWATFQPDGTYAQP
jgi:hypothetical protein